MDKRYGTISLKAIAIGVALLAVLIAVVVVTMPEAHDPRDDRTQPDPHIAPGR